MSAAEAMRLTMTATMETNHDLAVRLLLEAIEQDPDAVLARFHLATILGSRGLHGQAAAALRPTLSGAGSQNPGVRFLLARQLHLAGDPEAIEQYEATLILDPACEKAHLYLAQLIAPADDPHRPAAAEHATLALSLRPNNSMVPESEFVETYRAVVGHPPDAGALDHGGARDFSDEPLGRLMLLHPEVNRVLEEVGIVCAECAGYSLESLSSAAADVGADLASLNRRLNVIIGAMRHEEVDHLEVFVRN